MITRKSYWLTVVLAFFVSQFCFAEGQEGLTELMLIYDLLKVFFFICIIIILFLFIRKVMRLKSVEKKYAQIEIGSRGEGITYRFPNKTVELDSTWITGRRVFFKGKNISNLSDIERKELFISVVDFFNSGEKIKPIIVYNSDSENATLLKQLCFEYRDKIESVETSSLMDDEQNFYDSMKRDLETGRCTINIDGYVLKTVKDLDEYWEEKRQ